MHDRKTMFQEAVEFILVSLIIYEFTCVAFEQI
jgi:hypothetical protein